jgi:hypothetical protein
MWRLAAEWAKKSTVLVSEYKCPVPGATILWEKTLAPGLRFGTGGDGRNSGSKRKKRERLYCLTPKSFSLVGLGIL